MRTLISITALSLALSGLALAAERISDRKADRRASDAPGAMQAADAQRDRVMGRTEHPDPKAREASRDRVMGRADHPGKTETEASMELTLEPSGSAELATGRAGHSDPRAVDAKRVQTLSRADWPEPKSTESKPGDDVSAKEGGHDQTRAGS